VCVCVCVCVCVRDFLLVFFSNLGPVGTVVEL